MPILIDKLTNFVVDGAMLKAINFNILVSRYAIRSVISLRGVQTAEHLTHTILITIKVFLLSLRKRNTVTLGSKYVVKYTS